MKITDAEIWISKNASLCLVFADQVTFVTGFERIHLPRTQQQDVLFTITR